MVKGLMVAVGLSKEDILKILPENIYIACENSSSCYTLSGPAEATLVFMQELQQKGIFAKPVNSANYAFHCKYIEESSQYYLATVKNILTDPKPRSSKWLSTSVPLDKMVETWAKYNTAEYHHNNCNNPVLFNRVYQHIPENAIVIEIAPHGLLKSILKKELPKPVTYINLIDKSCSDSEQFLLSAIGR